MRLLVYTLLHRKETQHTMTLTIIANRTVYLATSDASDTSLTQHLSLLFR
jgi:hypothetical protein